MVTTVAQAEYPFLRACLTPRERRPPADDFDLIGNVNQALELLHGKWKVHLLFFMARGIHRHSRLLDCLPGASKKVMIDTLRALERDGLVNRRVYAEVPVRVEYSLTELGWSMTEPLMSLSEWGEAHSTDVSEACTRNAEERAALEVNGAGSVAA
jgi:DNA-binding HxlR family transcriptional regulator